MVIFFSFPFLSSVLLMTVGSGYPYPDPKIFSQVCPAFGGMTNENSFLFHHHIHCCATLFTLSVHDTNYRSIITISSNQKLIAIGTIGV